MSYGFRSTRENGVWVHTFDDDVDTGEAYDITQTAAEIRDGDVLVVAAEGVIGVMVEAWPTALTEMRGEFHGLKGGAAAIATLDDGKYEAAGAVAVAIVKQKREALAK